MEGLNDTYVCPNCNKSIPSMNRPTHEVRCARIQSQNAGDQSNNNRSKPSSNPQGNSNQAAAPPSNGPKRSSIVVKMAECPTCHVKVPETHLESHKNSCGDMQIPCEFCSRPISMDLYTSHADECARKSDYERTMEEQNAKVPCEFCEDLIPVNVYADHLKECSSQFMAPQHRDQQSPNRSVSGQSRPIVGRNSDDEDYHSFGEDDDGDTFIVKCDYCDEDVIASRYATHTETCIHFPRMSRQEKQRFVDRYVQERRPIGVNQRENEHNLFHGHLGRHQHDDEARSDQSDEELPIDQVGNERPQSQLGYGNHQANPPRQGNAITFNFSSGNSNVHRFGSPLHSHSQNIPFGGQEQAFNTQIIPNNRAHNDQSPTQVRQSSNDFLRGPILLNPLGGQGSLENLLGSIFGLNFSGLGNLSHEELVQMFQRERGLDKEMLNSFAVIKYDAAKSKDLDSELKKCAICIEEFSDGEEVKFLLCLHRFHKKCVDPWLESHTTCPICKKDFSKMEANE